MSKYLRFERYLSYACINESDKIRLSHHVDKQAHAYGQRKLNNIWFTQPSRIRTKLGAAINQRCTLTCFRLQ